MSELPNKILIVDHDQAILNQMEKFFKSKDMTVVCAKNYSDAMYHFNNNIFDLVIVELELEEMSGLTLIQKWKNHEQDTKKSTSFIICSGHKRKTEDEQLIVELENIAMITKPINYHTILSVITDHLNRNRQNEVLNEIDKKVISPLIQQKQFEKAVNIANTKLIPIGSKGKFRAAMVHEDAEKPEEALKILEELKTENPNVMKYHNQIGRINLKLGRLESAQAAYEHANKLAPHNLDRLNEMANMYLQLKEPDKSVACFDEVIKMNPENPDMKFDIFNKIYEAGFKDQARKFCKENSKVMDLIRHFNNTGVIHSKKGEYEAAIAEYHKAERLIPESKELYRVLYNQAIAHINLKSADNIKKADSILQRILEIKPDFEKAKDKQSLTQKFLEKLASKNPSAKPNKAS